VKVKPIIVILGRSGTGKSTSIRNLDASRTAIINTEYKPLPFKDGSKFKLMAFLDNPEDIFTMLERVKSNDEIDVLVIDSFTQWSNDLVAYCERTKKGFDRQNLYNSTIHDLFSTLKRIGKTVFIMCHEEIDTTSEGETIKQAKVEYKRKKGIVEESAIAMLYSTILYDEDKANPRYVFQVQPDPSNPAKSPQGMFEPGEKYIDNDLALVLEKSDAYYNSMEIETAKDDKNPKVDKVLGEDAK